MSGTFTVMISVFLIMFIMNIYCVIKIIKDYIEDKRYYERNKKQMYKREDDLGSKNM